MFSRRVGGVRREAGRQESMVGIGEMGHATSERESIMYEFAVSIARVYSYDV